MSRYVGLLEFYGKDDLIEMLEDIAFAYAVHHIENAEEISLMGATYCVRIFDVLYDNILLLHTI